MNELPSTEFRKRFARLTEPTVVTANGHPIGTWLPGMDAATVLRLVDAGVEPDAAIKSASSQSLQQAQRDELLHKINKGASDG